ncbi:MAG: AMP-binding protein [Planctomycetes bacterium]|nr:AMP-binding protein [Planctomycetota bacterium]
MMTLLPDELHALGLSPKEAERLVEQVRRLTSEGPVTEQWRRIAASVLKPEHPFAVHQYVREKVFHAWDHRAGPVPLWVPPPDILAESNLGGALRQRGLTDYADLHRWSVADPECFWPFTLARLGIRFREPPSRILAPDSDPRVPRWLPGAKLNICESCFRSPPDATAIVAGSASGEITRSTYGELGLLANRVSNGLVRQGLAPGDAIAIVMNMRPESVAVYLGIVQAGCVAVSIAESFAPMEIRRRLEISGAKVVFTAEHMCRGGRTLPLYEKVLQAGDVRAIVLAGPEHAGVGPAIQRPGDLAWRDFLSADTDFDTRIRAPGDCINILFSSGTTGDPKAVPWDHTTPIKCASDGYYHHDICPGDVVCWPTSLGWMMGPWLVFATLINRGTIALFDDVPTGRAFGEFVTAAGVSMLGVVPSLVRQWRATECMKGLDWSRIRAFGSTGECSNPDDMHYLMHLAGYRPIIEYCGGTEVGGGYITSTVIQPSAPSTFSGPAMGSDFVILDEAGAPADMGELFLAPPALGLSAGLLNADHHAIYFEGLPPGPRGELLRRHGDQMERLPGGYYRALGRADDTMNLGGIKVSSAEIERVLGRLEGVRDVAAIAAQPPGGGPSLLVIYAVVDASLNRPPDAWLAIMQQAIRGDLNPLFRIADVRLIDQLPRTASNKVMRRQLRAEYEAHGEHAEEDS